MTARRAARPRSARSDRAGAPPATAPTSGAAPPVVAPEGLAAAAVRPIEAPPERGVFCNRTLNLRSIRAIGYDMDYTLIHYHVDEWERTAYEHTRQRFLERGWPVADLRYDPASVTQGLTIDLELGNLVKANRFGYIIRASHGTRVLDFDAMRRAYAGTAVDLAHPRWIFLNTLFSYSESCLYQQLVDLLDARALEGAMGYADLYAAVRATLDAAHLEGKLKAEIVADPDRFVDLDPEAPLALLDQKIAGKKLLLVTNSEWDYTRSMLSWAFDRFLPDGMKWRDLFDIILVSARKPSFFTEKNPLYEVVDEERSLLAPTWRGLAKGGVFFGGNASLVEKHLGLSGDEILYVGDHLFGDVHVSKSSLRWRTALILREMEDEVRNLISFRETQATLTAMMAEKEALERESCRLRLAEQRRRKGYAPLDGGDAHDHEARLTAARARLTALDDRIAPLARAAGELGNAVWGPLMRAGNDKSLFARQVERYADVYTSHVSNFVYVTPFGFLRGERSSLPHDVT